MFSSLEMIYGSCDASVGRTNHNGGQLLSPSGSDYESERLRDTYNDNNYFHGNLLLCRVNNSQAVDHIE